MYERFYGLKEKPFSLTPDPEFLFLNKRFRGALDQVIYGIERHEGFTAIIGDVGTGKTTLCWALLRRLRENVRSALILNSLLSEEEMLRAIIQDFGIEPRRCAESDCRNQDGSYNPAWMHGLTRKDLIDELNWFLLEGLENDTINILILDEAQNLSPSVLEQLRVLSNLETSKRKLLQIIFVGQIEFDHMLKRPELRQLRQRITIRYELKPFSMAETALYIEHRLKVAGAPGSTLFTGGAIRRIYRQSGGYPRLINVACDRALLAGYSVRSASITARIVRKASRGLGIESEPAGPKVRFSGTRRMGITILGLLLLGLLAVVFALWMLRGFPGDLNSWFLKAVSRSLKEPSSPGSGVLQSVPASAALPRQTGPPGQEAENPEVYADHVVAAELSTSSPVPG